MQIAVTTSQDDDILIGQARNIAEELAIPYLDRNSQSLERIRTENNLDFVLVVEKEQLILKGQGGEYFWHPNMAVPRLKALRTGKNDPMLEAMGLKEGYQVLDCTLGLAADALVAAYGVGRTGHVIGLEISPVIAYLTSWGLANFRGRNTHIQALTGRITVYNESYQEHLLKQQDNAYDVVYFDPMFRRSQAKSSGLNAMRPLADPSPLNEEVIVEALRVARHRVVLKEGSDSQEFGRLQVPRVIGGKYSPLAYGIWEKTGG